MSEAAPTEAARRAAARKAKILARGNTGLQKLAQTARGEEADLLYNQESASSTPRSPPSPAPTSSSAPSWAPPSTSSTQPNSTSTSRRPQQPNTSTNATFNSQPSVSAEQQNLMSQLESMFGPMSNLSNPGQEGNGMPDMSQLLAQMMGGAGGGMSAGGGMPSLSGDLDDPAGLSGGMPPNPFAGFPGMQGLPGMQGMPGMPGMSPQPKSKEEKYFPLVHVLAVLGFFAFVLVWWEPTLWGKSNGWDIMRWGGLAGKSGSRFGQGQEEMAALPIFWAFTTLELILQTTRFFILKSPPAPHSLISTFLPMLPPKIATPLITGSRYLALLSQFYKDGCLLIFAVGMTVILGEYRRK